jgi:hypothetical protein
MGGEFVSMKDVSVTRRQTEALADESLRAVIRGEFQIRTI